MSDEDPENQQSARIPSPLGQPKRPADSDVQQGAPAATPANKPFFSKGTIIALSGAAVAGGLSSYFGLTGLWTGLLAGVGAATTAGFAFKNPKFDDKTSDEEIQKSLDSRKLKLKIGGSLLAFTMGIIPGRALDNTPEEKPAGEVQKEQQKGRQIKQQIDQQEQERKQEKIDEDAQKLQDKYGSRDTSKERNPKLWAERTGSAKDNVAVITKAREEGPKSWTKTEENATIAAESNQNINEGRGA